MVSIIAITSCNRTENKRPVSKDITQNFYSKDFKDKLDKKELTVLDIDTFPNFSELKENISALYCEDRVAGLTFSVNDAQYNLIGYADCKSKKKCLAASSLIFIQNDSIITDITNNQKVHISNLHCLIEDIQRDNYKYINSKDPEIPSLIFFHVDDTYPISLTKSILKEISINFDNPDLDTKIETRPYTIYFTHFQNK